ncbi:MAG: hypothetical protein CSA74_10790 [Rhodobacterales bacterium]|nr:MAG: hypothetical protein CSA74_10790 [Rhodobacterales bacterium]
MFKRKPRTWGRTALEFLYPRGGWWRAAIYVIHRIRRLPDPAHRISRGIGAGVFVCFTPFFGMHFVLATAIAWVIRGNIFAALLATFVGNPLTFPLIAEVSIGIGTVIVGSPDNIHLPQIVEAFSQAMGDVLRNLAALFTPAEADWRGVRRFWHDVIFPYFIGGLGPGIAAAVASYYFATPVITTYQKARVKRLRKRYEKRMAEAAARAEERAKAEEAESGTAGTAPANDPPAGTVAEGAEPG